MNTGEALLALSESAQFSEFLFQCEIPVRCLGLRCRKWATRRASARRVLVTIGQGLVRALDGLQTKSEDWCVLFAQYPRMIR
jgi:hypothetical protein